MKKEVDIARVVRILKERDMGIFLEVLGGKDNLIKFCNNCQFGYHKYGKNGKIFSPYTVCEYVENVCQSLILINAFSWVKTKEHDAFWRDLNYKYREKIGKNPSDWNCMSEMDEASLRNEK